MSQASQQENDDNGKHGADAVLVSSLATVPAVDPVRTEPRAWMEPNPARRGLLEVRGGQFLHFCPECGRWASVGIGFNPPHSLGRWWCPEHRPAKE